MLLKRQEIIEFDPSKKEHRAAAHAFMRRGAWADSPLRFAYDPSYGSVADQVKAKLLDWYIAQETKPKKQSKLAERVSKSKTIIAAGLPATIISMEKQA
jgi:hypothetical protein